MTTVVPGTRRRAGADAAPGARRAGRVAAVSGDYWVLLSLVAVLVLFGLVMVLSASSVVSREDYGSSWALFARQCAWAVLGTGGFVVFAGLDRALLRRLAAPALGVVVALLVAVLVPGVGVGVNGATRWLGWGPVQIQPSEFAKLVVVVWAADLLARRSREMDDLGRTLVPVLGALGLLATLVLAQPNLGTTIVLVTTLLTVLWVAGTPTRPIFVLGSLAALGATYLVLTTDFRRARFFAFLNPWADPEHTGYQNVQSLIGLGEGGAFGVGLGSSRAKYGYLPEAQTDFIYAIVGEELGLLGAALVLVLFIGLAVVGMRIAIRSADRFGTLLAAGITTWLVAQAFVNVGAVIGLIPITGVPLPFISYGGSALLVNLCAAGLLANVARTARPERAGRDRARAEVR